MRYGSRELKGPREDIIVFPREDGDIAFKLRMVMDFEPFDRLYPMPEPPNQMRKGETVATSNVESPIYLAAINVRQHARVDWIILETLKPTEELTWETVTSDPATWGNYIKELQEAGFNPPEIERLRIAALQLNGVNDDKMEEAKKRFLERQAAAVR